MAAGEVPPAQVHTPIMQVFSPPNSTGADGGESGPIAPTPLFVLDAPEQNASAGASANSVLTVQSPSGSTLEINSQGSVGVFDETHTPKVVLTAGNDFGMHPKVDVPSNSTGEESSGSISAEKPASPLVTMFNGFMSMADADNNTRGVLDSTNGQMNTYTETGAAASAIGPNGFLVTDGTTDVLYLSKDGVQGLNPDGNVTMVFDPVGGNIIMSGKTTTDAAGLSADTLKQSKADFCTKEHYQNCNAMYECETEQMNALINQFGLTMPAQRTCDSSKMYHGVAGMAFTAPPPLVADSMGRGLDMFATGMAGHGMPGFGDYFNNNMDAFAQGQDMMDQMLNDLKQQGMQGLDGKQQGGDQGGQTLPGLP